MSHSVVTETYLRWIGILVIAQLYVIGFLACITLGLLKWRQWKSRRIEVLKEAYGESIADVACGEDTKLFVPRPHRWQFIRRRALKEALLDNIAVITGNERDILVNAYCSMGLAAADMKSCESVWWARRLEGLMSLAQLRRQEFADVFERMRADKKPLVSSCAILSLSYLDTYREEPEMIMDHLPPSFFENSNMLFELTNNFVRRYGLERFEDYVRTHTHTHVGQAILAVLTNVNTPEATVFLLEIYTTNQFEDKRLVIRIERAIRESNDQVMIEQLEYFQTARGVVAS